MIGWIHQSAYYVKVRAYYGQFERRDQLAIKGLGALLGVAVLYFAVWSPAMQFVASAEADRQRSAELLAWMRGTESQARQASRTSGGSRHSGQSLLTLIPESTRKAKVASPDRMQPEGNDSVSVWFDAVSFNDLIAWLEQLERDEGVVVRQITIDRQDQPGMVVVRLILKS